MPVLDRQRESDRSLHLVAAGQLAVPHLTAPTTRTYDNLTVTGDWTAMRQRADCVRRACRDVRPPRGTTISLRPATPEITGLPLTTSDDEGPLGPARGSHGPNRIAMEPSRGWSNIFGATVDPGAFGGAAAGSAPRIRTKVARQ